jgi:hypothetical protein
VSTPLLTLGRNVMGANATEADFDSFVAFVCARIDDACGFEVDVAKRRPRDVQENAITCDDDGQREAIQYAIEALWDAWCTGGAVQS